MKFNEKVKAVRKHLELTQTQFAAAVGKQQGEISIIESGRFLPVNPAKFLETIESTFNIEIKKIISKEGTDAS